MTETVHNNCPGCGAPINSVRCPYCGRDHDIITSIIAEHAPWEVVRGRDGRLHRAGGELIGLTVIQKG